MHFCISVKTERGISKKKNHPENFCR